MPNAFVSAVPSGAGKESLCQFLQALRGEGYRVDATVQTSRLVRGKGLIDGCVDMNHVLTTSLSLYDVLCLDLTSLLEAGEERSMDMMFALAELAVARQQVVLCNEREYPMYLSWQRAERPAEKQITGIFAGIARLLCASHHFYQARIDVDLGLGPHDFGPSRLITKELAMYRDALAMYIAEAVDENECTG